jgi:hypothetical protein
MAFDVDRSLIFLGPSRSKNDVTIHGAVTQDRSWQASCLVPAVKSSDLSSIFLAHLSRLGRCIREEPEPFQRTSRSRLEIRKQQQGRAVQCA